jgi:hypothetical protein
MSRVRAVTTTAAVLSALLLLPSGPAAALPTIVFGQLSPGVAGTVSWAGGLLPLVGRGIVFQSVVGVDTPSNSGPLAALDCVIDCVLNFETGPYSGNVAGIDIWNPGGYFTVTGDLDGIAETPLQPLLGGTWTSLVTKTGGILTNFAGQGVDIKDAALLSYFGFAPDTAFNFASTIQTGATASGVPLGSR